ncbi:MAG: HDOD domain-containing protein [Planctomycetota bacterium]
MPTKPANNESLRREMLAVFRRAKLPTCPSIAARVLALINDPSTSAKDFAVVIESDPALAARLLKIANAAYFGQRGTITNIKRALTLVGLRQLRLIVLGFELVGHLDKLGGRAFDLPRFWRDAVLRACVARALARRVVPRCAEEAFIVGLLQDCGVLVLAQIFGPEYAELYGAVGNQPAAFHEAERSRFSHDHVEAMDVLTDQWDFPDLIRAPMRWHHRPVPLEGDTADVQLLAAVAYVAGSVCLETGPTGESPDLCSYCRDTLGLEKEDVEEILEESEADFGPAAALLDLALPDDLDVAELMVQANDHLNRALDELGRQVREAEDERDFVQRENLAIRHALGQYRDRAARDPLTDLLNRGALLATAISRLEAARAADEPVTVLFVDLDNFKRVNDVFGHRTGDELLVTAANVLRSGFGPDSVVGRYGGEEFVVLDIGADLEETRRRVVRLLEAVRNIELPNQSGQGTTTCSIGCLWESVPTDESIDSLIAIADELMYRAKQAGKDCACLRRAGDTGHNDLRHPAAVEMIGQHEPLLPSVTDGQPVDESDLRRVAEKLNRQAQRQIGSTRKIERLPSMTSATLTVVHTVSIERHDEECFVRNTSLGGVGLLVGRRIRKGDILEIRVDSDAEPTFIAGVVAFCRHLGGSIHELGLQLLQHAREQILSGDPARTARNLEMFHRTIRDRARDENDIKRSA